VTRNDSVCSAPDNRLYFSVCQIIVDAIAAKEHSVTGSNHCLSRVDCERWSLWSKMTEPLRDAIAFLKDRAFSLRELVDVCCLINAQSIVFAERLILYF